MKDPCVRYCVKCEKPTDENLVTAYGGTLCGDCWDDYLMTDCGKVEYLIGIVRGDYPANIFDADFLGHVAKCWFEYRDRVVLSSFDRAWVEAKAMAMGLL